VSNNFKIGEVVQLKSGGPIMTIHNIGDYAPTGFNPGVLCVWFAGVQKNEAVFHPDALERYEPPPFSELMSENGAW
jgi:uncharacterized protein YodC (DUF2158 family)